MWCVWLEHCPLFQKECGWIPSGSLCGTSVFLFLSLPFSLSKINKTYPWVKIIKYIYLLYSQLCIK